jgi:Cu2+-exporting ATPase
MTTFLAEPVLTAAYKAPQNRSQTTPSRTLQNRFKPGTYMPGCHFPVFERVFFKRYPVFEFRGISMNDKKHEYDHDRTMEHASTESHEHDTSDKEKHAHGHQAHYKTESSHEHHAGQTANHSHNQHIGQTAGPTHGRHAGHTVEAFRKRFWISLAATIPILLLTPQIQNILGIGKTLAFPGQNYLLFALSSFVYFYGGFPFLQGMVREIREKLPGMMTLIGVAITVAFVYSTATVFGLPGMPFFWELATLIDIMLLGHWLEMRSIMGASQALEQLARLMPSEAHKFMPDGNTANVPLDKLDIDDKVLVKPGEKLPVDGTVVDGKSSVNESMLTGESKPVQKSTGNEVIGGSILSLIHISEPTRPY